MESFATFKGFFVRKMPYKEVTQWQEKEIRNLSSCVLGALAMALRQPHSTPVQPVRCTLTSFG